MVRATGFAVLAAVALTGCVQAPPPPPPAMLVAYPGQGKTEDMFRADDAACQAEAARGPASAGPTTEAATLSPGQVFLRCMAMRGNVVQPLVASQPPTILYRSYVAYPVYSGFGDYNPWLYGGYAGFGYYGGGYRGYREGYGFRGEFREGFRGENRDGFRGEGRREDGFRGGEGFRRGGERR